MHLLVVLEFDDCNMLSRMKMAITPRFSLREGITSSSENVSGSSMIIPIHGDGPVPWQRIGMVMDVPETSVIAELLSGI